MIRSTSERSSSRAKRGKGGVGTEDGRVLSLPSGSCSVPEGTKEEKREQGRRLF